MLEITDLDFPRWSTGEVGRFFGCTASTITKLCSSGVVRASRCPGLRGEWRVSHRELLRQLHLCGWPTPHEFRPTPVFLLTASTPLAAALTEAFAEVGKQVWVRNTWSQFLSSVLPWPSPLAYLDTTFGEEGMVLDEATTLTSLCPGIRLCVVLPEGVPACYYPMGQVHGMERGSHPLKPFEGSAWLESEFSQENLRSLRRAGRISE